jgi:cysteinyl-tRNA synthetase
VALRIFDTLSQKKEEFVPLKPGVVTMYVCGPTVYGLLHVGNFRGPIFFNLVRAWLEKSGYKVEFAYNYTDVDDKIIDRAKQDGVTAEEIAEKYIGEFQTDFKALRLKKHTYNPKVTDSMKPIVEIVSSLIENKKAYVTPDGEVLYSVRSFDGYGKLSKKNLDDLQAGARVEIDKKKKDPMDFALWKPAKPGEPKWPSPWCDGRPGWHIECSAMVKSIFGDSVDIHGGGSDLIFPHHENEIAQSEGATGIRFARYWMHNNMLTFGDKKMSKSLGNILTARAFLEKYDAEILKYMMLSVHYRSLSDFSEDAVAIAIHGLAKFYSALASADRVISAGSAMIASAPSKGFADLLASSSKAISDGLNDDFNTPEMFAAIHGVIKAFNSTYRPGQKITPEILATANAFRAWMNEQGELLSLLEEEPASYLHKLDDRLLHEKSIERSDIDRIVAERTAARGAKDFKKSDELRDLLLTKGIAIQDSPSGTLWEVAK